MDCSISDGLGRVFEMNTLELFASTAAIIVTLVLVHIQSNRKREQWNSRVEKQLIVIRSWIFQIAKKQKIALDPMEELLK